MLRSRVAHRLADVCRGVRRRPATTLSRAPGSRAAVERRRAPLRERLVAPEPGAPRELLALNADGSKVQRLTSCAEAATPCDMLQAAPAPRPHPRRGDPHDPDAEAGDTGLYFMDLSRAVEKLLFARRRVTRGRLVPRRLLPDLQSTAPGAHERRGPVLLPAQRHERPGPHLDHRPAGAQPAHRPERDAPRSSSRSTRRESGRIYVTQAAAAHHRSRDRAGAARDALPRRR